jgi:hypothetical protein
MVTPHTHPRLLASLLEVYPDLLEALWGRKVIVYNASYDVIVLGGNAQQKHGDLGQGRPVLEVLTKKSETCSVPADHLSKMGTIDQASRWTTLTPNARK